MGDPMGWKFKITKGWGNPQSFKKIESTNLRSQNGARNGKNAMDSDLGSNLHSKGTLKTICTLLRPGKEQQLVADNNPFPRTYINLLHERNFKSTILMMAEFNRSPHNFGTSLCFLLGLSFLRGHHLG